MWPRCETHWSWSRVVLTSHQITYIRSRSHAWYTMTTMAAICSQWKTTGLRQPVRDSAHRRVDPSVVQLYFYTSGTVRLVYTQLVCCSRHILIAPMIEIHDLADRIRVAGALYLTAMYLSMKETRTRFCWYSTTTLELFHVVEWYTTKW